MENVAYLVDMLLLELVIYGISALVPLCVLAGCSAIVLQLCDVLVFGIVCRMLSALPFRLHLVDLRIR